MLSSYAQFDRLVPHFDFPEVQSLIDNLDIVVGSQAMWAELARRFRPMPPSTQPGRGPRSRPMPSSTRSRNRPSPRELRLYDRYTDVLAISRSEAEAIRRGTHRTTVHYVPMAVDPYH